MCSIQVLALVVVVVVVVVDFVRVVLVVFVYSCAWLMHFVGMEMLLAARFGSLSHLN